MGFLLTIHVEINCRLLEKEKQKVVDTMIKVKVVQMMLYTNIKISYDYFL